MTAQGQFETFNATIDQMGSMLGVTIEDSEKEDFTNEVMGSLIDLLVPVYQKHFSEQDLKDAIEMYKSVYVNFYVTQLAFERKRKREMEREKEKVQGKDSEWKKNLCA